MPCMLSGCQARQQSLKYAYLLQLTIDRGPEGLCTAAAGRTELGKVYGCRFRVTSRTYQDIPGTWLSEQASQLQG